MRSLWNGSISFGLVNIPVKLYSATEDRVLSFDLLDSSDLSNIKYKRVNEKTGEEVEWKDIIKGYKLGEKYVTLSKEDFEKANMKKSKTIDIEEFVDEEEIADMLFKKPYYLEPAKGGEKSYALLQKALKKSKKVGIATFVMRQKEHLSVVGIYKNVIVLHVIRFADEIRDVEGLKVPSKRIPKKEMDMALNLIDQYSTDFKFEKYKDVYNSQLLKMIKAKSKGKSTKTVKLKSDPTPAKDLMAQLKASLEKKKSKAS